MNNKSLIEFGEIISQFTPLQVGAIAKILGVKLVTDELEEREDGKEIYKARAGNEIAEEVFTKFSQLNRKQKRDLLKVMRKALPSKTKEVNSDGANAQHSEET